MYNSLIVDDEHKLREVLKSKLQESCPQINIVGEAEDIFEAKRRLEKEDIHILFLDIAMPGGSGFDLISKLKNIDFEIIFITGFGEYAIDALKVSAVDYLLKPIKTTELVEAVDKAIIKIAESEKARKYELLQYNINNIGDQNTKVAIPGNDAYDFVKINQIIRCEGWNKYTKVFLLDGSVLVSSYNIGVFKDMLENYGFYPSHKSHLVNKSHIKKYLKEGVIIMCDDSQIPLARRRKENFVGKVMSGNIIR